MTQPEHVSRIRHTPDEDLAAVVTSMRRALTNSDRFGYTREREIAQLHETMDPAVLGMVGAMREER